MHRPSKPATWVRSPSPAFYVTAFGGKSSNPCFEGGFPSILDGAPGYGFYASARNRGCRAKGQAKQSKTKKILESSGQWTIIDWKWFAEIKYGRKSNQKETLKCTAQNVEHKIPMSRWFAARAVRFCPAYQHRHKCRHPRQADWPSPHLFWRF